MFSGGVGSWAAAKRVAATHGTENLTLLFADTRSEDPDLYRFLDEAAADVGGTLVRIAEGRTIWEVFHDERFLGNSRVDPCSKILKRQVSDRWMAANRDPADTTVYVGIDWSERHRFTRLAERRLPWRYEAPLCDAPFLAKADVFAQLKATGIRLPRLYEMGFAHNNCGGGCVKAGIKHFVLLHSAMPDVYAAWEQNESALRDRLGDVSILRDRTKAQSRPLTLRELRMRIEEGFEPDFFEEAPIEQASPTQCNCFAPPCDGDAVDEELELIGEA
jgi:hypothetical protein